MSLKVLPNRSNRQGAFLRLFNSQEDWLQENREALSERLELSFEQSRNGETYTPEQARQILAKRKASRQWPRKIEPLPTSV